jgi:hypothetical protein
MLSFDGDAECVGVCVAALVRRRVIKTGGDKRFDKAMKQPATLLVFWMLQVRLASVAGRVVYAYFAFVSEMNGYLSALHPRNDMALH